MIVFARPNDQFNFDTVDREDITNSCRGFMDLLARRNNLSVLSIIYLVKCKLIRIISLLNNIFAILIIIIDYD